MAEGNLNMDNATKIYRELIKVPSVVHSTLYKPQDDCHCISTVWSQRDIERGETIRYNTTHGVFGDLPDDVSKVVRMGASTELTNELLCRWSPSRQHKAVIRQLKNKTGDEKQYLEIWNQHGKESSIDLDALDKHGKIYEDDLFGCLEWSSLEDKIMYIAEKKQPKKVSYFDPKHSRMDDMKSAVQEPILKGEEYSFLEDWGETLVSKHHPVICIMNLRSQRVQVIDWINQDVSPGEPSWSPGDTGIVFVGYWHEPYRLGARGCTNRRSAVFYVDLKTKDTALLSDSDHHVRSVRFSPDKSKFVYLSNAARGPCGCDSQIVMYDWTTKNTEIVVNLVDNPEDASMFPGVYCLLLPQQCWANDNQRIFLDTMWRSKQELISVNVETKEVTRVTNDPLFGGWVVLDMYDGMIMATRSSPNTPPQIVLGKIPSVGQESTISWLCVDNQSVNHDDITWTTVVYAPSPKAGELAADVMDYECILVKPRRTDNNKKPPLIVHPHGGPHTAFMAEYMLSPAFFCKMGFATLLVNYRGSLGFGHTGVLSLPGNVGSQDVKDVQNAVQSVIESGVVDKDRIVLTGGSHGGFLATHLIGQYPDFYKACCTKNPATNIASILGSTDIPDWCYTEAGLDFEASCVPSAKTYEAMLEKSPIVYVDQVKTPLMFMLGAEDRRVPPKQGQEYYRAVKARGVETKLYMYPENNHSLSKVDCEGDCMLNMYKWFITHI